MALVFLIQAFSDFRKVTQHMELIPLVWQQEQNLEPHLTSSHQ